MLLPLLVAIAGPAWTSSAVGLTSHVMTLGSDAPTVAALIGLGVGIDYALFIVTRHRTGLRTGLAPSRQRYAHLHTSGRAVVFAGLTVVTALLGLLVLRIGPLSAMGISAATAVGETSVIAARHPAPGPARPLRGTIPPTRVAAASPDHPEPRDRSPAPEQEGHGTGSPSRWAEQVERHRTLFAVAALLVVTVLSSAAALSLRLGTSDAGNHPKGTTTRAAYDLLAQGFGAAPTAAALVAEARPATGRP